MQVSDGGLGWGPLEAQVLGLPGGFHIPPSTPERAPVGIRGTVIATRRASTPPRAGDCGEVPRTRHPFQVGPVCMQVTLSLALRVEDPAWAVPATPPPKSQRHTPPLSPPSLSFNSLAVVQQLLFKHLHQGFVAVKGMAFSD